MKNSTSASPTSKSLPCDKQHEGEPMRDKGQAVEPAEAVGGSPSPAPPSASGRLAGRVRRPAQLLPAQRDRMYALLVHYFKNVTRPQFDEDLFEKEWVIILTDAASGQIQGFSTLMRLQVEGSVAIGWPM